MKYAFIVLIAIYLVTYGCSPDKSEEAQSSHEQAATTAVENSPPSEMAAAPADPHEQAPPTDVQQHQTVAAEPVADPQADESEMVVMPCGKTMAKGDVPKNAPCLEMHEQDVMIAPGSDEELSAAMERMVETTNGVIVATRQLVSATYLMLNAGKGVAEEIVEQATEQSAADQEAEAAPEQEVVETMQSFISAAREVIDATNQAIYSVLEEKQQQQ